MTTQVHTHEAGLACQAGMMVLLIKQKVQNDNLAFFLEKMLNFDFEPVILRCQCQAKRSVGLGLKRV